MSIRLLLTLFFLLGITSAGPAVAKENTQVLEQLPERLVVEQKESSGLVDLGAVIIQNGKFIGPFVSGEKKREAKFH